MTETTIYRVSSHDPLRGLGAQGSDHMLVTSVEDGERWVRNLYASAGASEQVGPMRQVGKEPLWTMDASCGRVWFIARAIIHRPTCPLLYYPSDADAHRCACDVPKEPR